MPDANNMREYTPKEVEEFLGGRPSFEPLSVENKFIPTNDNSKDLTEVVEKLIEKVESLEGYLRLIFDGHVLIDGQFIKIK